MVKIHCRRCGKHLFNYTERPTHGAMIMANKSRLLDGSKPKVHSRMPECCGVNEYTWGVE